METPQTTGKPAECPDVDLARLVGQFHQASRKEGGSLESDSLGGFTPVETVPPPYDALLDHDSHMTVTVEDYLGQLVEVLVHGTDRRGSWYAREITLRGVQTHQTVQYGIVRLDVRTLAPEVWRRIEGQGVPLGRVLIEHNVLRRVRLCQLWRITPGRELARALAIGSVSTGTGETSETRGVTAGVDRPEYVYGRTARIFCDGLPAIELLEIVIA